MINEITIGNTTHKKFADDLIEERAKEIENMEDWEISARDFEIRWNRLKSDHSQYQAGMMCLDDMHKSDKKSVRDLAADMMLFANKNGYITVKQYMEILNVWIND